MAPRDGPRTLVPITITSTNVDQEWKIWWPLNISLQAIINTIEDLTHHHAPDHRLDWNGRDLFSDLSKQARDVSLWHVSITSLPSHSFTQSSTPRPPDLFLLTRPYLIILPPNRSESNAPQPSPSTLAPPTSSTATEKSTTSSSPSAKMHGISPIVSRVRLFLSRSW